MTPYVVFNGATGGLGARFGAALRERGLSASRLNTRLGDAAGLIEELDQLTVDPESRLVLIQSAGMVSVPECEQQPEAAHDINVTRTIDAVRTFVEWATARRIASRVLFVSSAHVYAASEPGERLTESAPTAPRSVYATTKLEAERGLTALADVFGIEIAVCRVFGAIGPDQRPHYLLPGLINRVRTGDLIGVPGLDYVRDYLDTRDIARHLASVSALTGSVVVNVCSGEGTRIGDLLDELLALIHAEDPAALEDARSRVSAAPGRDTDVPWSVGDPTLLAELVGEPIRSIPLSTTLADAVGI